ncbi:transposase [Candidatus Woesebacteria bacterium]|nr:transposase [Candidatus Woesebacteria bacterium]
MRPVVLENNETYHVFNRGIEKRNTFTSKREFDRAILTIDYYRHSKPFMRLSKALLLNIEERSKFFEQLKNNGDKQVSIISYCLMPNHFHFLLKQNQDSGISRFVSNFSNSYTRYFNTRNKGRVGPLFQGIFKSVLVEDDNQLMHVHRYIHINPATSYVVKSSELENYPWSSLPEYLGKTKFGICDKEIILNNFKTTRSYGKFIFNQIDYARKLEKIKHLTLE